MTVITSGRCDWRSWECNIEGFLNIFVGQALSFQSQKKGYRQLSWILALNFLSWNPALDTQVRTSKYILFMYMYVHICMHIHHMNIYIYMLTHIYLCMYIHKLYTLCVHHMHTNIEYSFNISMFNIHSNLVYTYMLPFPLCKYNP